MPIENLLNGRIATLLDRMSSRWEVHGEDKGAFRGNQKQPDILVIQTGAQPVVIENEYVPARNVEAEARERLGEFLDSSVVKASGRINSAISLKSPKALEDCTGLDDVDAMLIQGITLEYALNTGLSETDFTRFPREGYIQGTIKDLAAFVVYAATPEDAVQRAVLILEQGVQDGATKLREAQELSRDTQGAAMAELLKQPHSEQTLRMAATILTNALMFHQNLAGQHEVRNLDQIASDGVLTQAAVLEEWRKILDVNYWSIFKIASDLLRSINPPGMAAEALRVMRSTADRLIALGVSQSHDLAGTVFQTLIADRKFLAANYTRPESAALLSHLAILDDGCWGDPERVKDFRIADYACGTGTLIHAAYRRLNQLHWLAGGDPEKLHAHLMENALTACDVLPSAVHLTASMLSSSHPGQRYGETRTMIAQYGKTEEGPISIGSLDLLDDTRGFRTSFRMHAATPATGKGGARSRLSEDMPPFSQNLVIMNPPYSSGGSDYTEGNPAGYNKKQFHGLGTDWETQEKMFKLARKYAKGTCAHGYAGLGSWFVALANRMVRKDGTIALVLPLTALQGTSWQKVRQLIASKYRDVKVLTIAAARQNDQSFSSETGMAETLVVCRESSNAPSRRGLFVSLRRRPQSEMEATEIARAITVLAESQNVRTLEGGPFGGNPVFIGEEQLGEVVDAPLSTHVPWSAVGISDFAVVQTAFRLVKGEVWFPRMQEQDALPLPMTSLGSACQIGITDNNIVGNGSQTAFDLVKPPSSAPTHPMLWSHNAAREKRMVVVPDSEGRIKPGREARGGVIWDTRSHAHHNRDFRFNSQPLAVAFTETQTIGGRAWPNVQFDDRSREVAYTLWGNSTLGLLCYWWHSSRQQAGRGSMPITAIRSMPTLDVTKLTPAQLGKAEQVFEDMRKTEFLPANEAHHDTARHNLDYRVLVEMLGLPESIIEPLDLLRLKWCSEPSVHGGKRTAPGS